MNKVSILLLEQVNLAGMESARQSFLEMNNYFDQLGQSAQFEVKLVGAKSSFRLNGGLYMIQADQLLKDV